MNIGTTIEAFSKSLKPGGWCFILNEPNLIHTFVSYRIARLSNTHEIGISPVELKKTLHNAEFSEIRYSRNKHHWFIKPTWGAARFKPGA